MGKIAWIVMVGSRPIAAFTGDEAEQLAPIFSGMLAHSGADDPPDIARTNGVWLSRVDQDPIGPIGSGIVRSELLDAVKKVCDKDRARVHGLSYTTFGR